MDELHLWKFSQSRALSLSLSLFLSVVVVNAPLKGRKNHALLDLDLNRHLYAEQRGCKLILSVERLRFHRDRPNAKRSIYVYRNRIVSRGSARALSTITSASRVYNIGVNAVSLPAPVFLRWFACNAKGTRD